jgi:hypothetical protein
MGTTEELVKEEEEEESTQDDPIDCTVLGTSADDQECHHPHVLTPPIMEQIRKHLPYVVSNERLLLAQIFHGTRWFFYACLSQQ